MNTVHIRPWQVLILIGITMMAYGLGLILPELRLRI